MCNVNFLVLVNLPKHTPNESNSFLPTLVASFMIRSLT